MNRMLAAALAAIGLFAAAVPVQAQDAAWQGIVSRARGQTVYWNAWGGSTQTNDFIAWVGGRVKAEFGVTLEHVKLRDTSEAVSRVLAEKTAGRTENGAVDLIWINGENFLAMRQNQLLYGPWSEKLPNYRLVDTKGKPSTTIDFTVPVDGMESPWAMAQIVFIYDSARLKVPPRSMPDMLAWAKANPGRLTHPQVRNFLGSTFLKQALYELASDPAVLQQPATDGNFGPATAGLWTWYDALKPSLWRQGRQFPETGPAQQQLLADGEIDISLSFNPADASNAIAAGALPNTVRTFVLDRGTIGNTSFVAIPFNAAHKEGAQVVANFLISPEAQARAQDPRVLGSFTVLAVPRLTQAEQKLFADLPRGVATLSNEELGTTQLEPHPSWMTRIVAEWQRRYGS
jgi:putative thiamine transport system substrate-binding protein